MTQYVSVNKHRIARNIKRAPEDREPVISVRTTKSGKAEYGDHVVIKDSLGRVVAEFIYSPDKPLLSCGARLILKTTEFGSAEVVSENESQR